ncbi:MULTISPECIES: helix-turn-helix transcriptional regulator [Thermoanaerobacter]|uniref:Transcriptional regulator, XRE family n=2 Tax=Thermoanaerobacter TaxID=1754 RepID=B0K844_THEP3|nr:MULTISPECIES: helix-turn-helix transcriptional regulator [Thermoanaerobacter]ABY95864.1 transcriptional regulator, XRE family [Thermoanaerobacter pseudethanolicus ATCC 33223]ADV80789.1 helix-turn-helix domain protein [Thermoanaerobacter brockii subsp. finnii Ako-1]SFE06795.1 putative transcriptional regulator [Thermoanaerobacter thermohydrosulfuricus]HBW59828.1 XRE family transcriptional regulator [Thermoanaerobacter sp.]
MFSLAELRKSRRLTQEQLSKLLGISKSSIAMYETGQRVPSLSRAKKIAKFFNVPVEKIFFGDINHTLRAKNKSF